MWIQIEHKSSMNALNMNAFKQLSKCEHMYTYVHATLVTHTEKSVMLKHEWWFRSIIYKLMLSLDSLLKYAVNSQNNKRKRTRERGNVKLNGFIAVILISGAENLHRVMAESPRGQTQVSVQLLSRVRLFGTHGLQHARPPSPSPTPGVYPNLCPSSRWCHPTISSSVVPFSSCPQSFPASGSFPVSQLFASGGQSIGVSASASVLPMNTQDWSTLGWTKLADNF